MSQFLVVESYVKENELKHNENLVKTYSYKKELNWGVAVVNGICEFMYMHVSAVWLKHAKNNFPKRPTWPSSLFFINTEQGRANHLIQEKGEWTQYWIISDLDSILWLFFLTKEVFRWNSYYRILVFSSYQQ